jgi:hypothetical protein
MGIAKNRRERDAIARGFEATATLWEYARSTKGDNPSDPAVPPGYPGCMVAVRGPW